MDTQKIDLILKYILAVAGQEDPGCREVGPIHLIKYVYLADLAYAEIHEGETFTDVEWQFYHFGPWSAAVYGRIKEVVVEVNATERIVTSHKYESDIVRWKLQDKALLKSLQPLLSFEIRQAIRDAIHEFGDDTTGLLHHVYTTWPMLHAAPYERLQFTRRKEGAVIVSKEQKLVEAPQAVKPSKKEMKQKKEKMAGLKERIQKRLADRIENQKLVKPEPPPRYDDIYVDGVARLDELAGTPVVPGAGKIVFSNDIWKSRARSDEGIS